MLTANGSEALTPCDHTHMVGIYFVLEDALTEWETNNLAGYAQLWKDRFGTCPSTDANALFGLTQNHELCPDMTSRSEIGDHERWAAPTWTR